MWHEVTKLFKAGLTKSQISRELSLDRGTIRRYLGMSESEFLSSNSYRRLIESKVSPYKDFIKDLLGRHPYLSSSQVHDRLRENFPDFPPVHRNTVYNYVYNLRAAYNIPKSEESSCRIYNKMPETLFGEYAQVDFGEKWIYTNQKRSIKVYFFALVLSRSRYKYIYFQRTPFTSATAIYAHELAFDYLGGIPHKIIYDQDKVFIHKENFGDYLLTDKFKRFCSSVHFEAIFCRKSDPESKGKVENVVKYVKNNFLKGRDFTTIESLNKEGLSWLERTGNGLMHHGTRLIPSSVFEEEQSYLLPYHGTPTAVEEVSLEYTVRKDNTINYRGNFYSLPSGTYSGQGSLVVVMISDRELIIHSKETGKILTTHTISSCKGKSILNPQHRRKDRTTITNLEESIFKYLSNSEIAKLYIEGLSTSKPRYYLDNMKHLFKYMRLNTPDDILKAMISHINSNIYNTGYLISDLSNNQVKISLEHTQVEHIDMSQYQPEKRSIDEYKEVLA